MAPDLISVAQARERVLSVTGRLELEQVDVTTALDRVLAEDVLAAGDVPPFACSAMDGYAILAGPPGRTLTVVGESRAGTPTDRGPADGEAIRISTGAAVPAGATAVIRQEDVESSDSVIRTESVVGPGENIRQAGEDLRRGNTVLRSGTVLGAAELGATVAAGAGHVTVARRPVVAVLCTGDELKAPGEPLGPGEIHNSNAVMLAALAASGGALIDRVDRLPDDRARTEAALSAALEGADVVLVSGGVSVGPHDHVKPALASLGVGEIFWGVALQPGKPTWFGQRERKLVFGLPGNPVSAVVTFSLFARPALAALQGAAPHRTLEREALLGTAVRRNPGREQAVRVRLEREQSRTIAHPNGPQDSHLLSSLLGADALAMIPPGDGALEAGSTVALETLAN
jgi:molybdopterin molybdotransferase